MNLTVADLLRMFFWMCGFTLPVVFGMFVGELSNKEGDNSGCMFWGGIGAFAIQFAVVLAAYEAGLKR